MIMIYDDHSKTSSHDHSQSRINASHSSRHPQHLGLSSRELLNQLLDQGLGRHTYFLWYASHCAPRSIICQYLPTYHHPPCFSAWHDLVIHETSNVNVLFTARTFFWILRGTLRLSRYLLVAVCCPDYPVCSYSSALTVWHQYTHSRRTVSSEYHWL